MQRITYSSLGAAPEEVHVQFEAAVQRLRAEAGQAFGLRIGGQTREGKGDLFSDLCPADTRIVLGLFRAAAAADVSKAVATASGAFSEWSRVPWESRAALLRKAAAIIDERQCELAALVTLETGKTRSEALAEACEAASLIRFYCAELERNQGYVVPMGEGGSVSRSILKPYGVWAVITPFSFPLAIPAGMIACALLAGNTVVLKAASDAPRAGLVFSEILEQAGVPAGAVNFIVGPGPTTGELLLSDPGIAGAAFAGSRAVGLQVLARFARGMVKPCVVELAGKNPALVMPSADLDLAADSIARAAFGFSGQKAAACSRVIVHKAVHRQFMKTLIEKTQKLTLGDPAERVECIGPLINAVAAKHYERAIRHILYEGRILLGGRRIRRTPFTRGFYAEPAIVDQLPRDSESAREPLFAPILAATRAASLEAAIAEANDTPGGLSAAIFTSDKDEQQAFLDGVQAGTLFCNPAGSATTGAWPGAQSFGGWKSSGSTGKNVMGPYYLQQFMREQSQTLA